MDKLTPQHFPFPPATTHPPPRREREQRAEQHRCYIVATCDKELKRRIRKIPGVPIMYISNRKFSIERMAEAFGAPPT